MTFSALLIGSESLTIQTGTLLREAGHQVAAVVTHSADIRRWAEDRDIPVIAAGPGLAGRLDDVRVDWLVSAANLDMLPQAVLDRAAQGAVNFHDGPLPRYAGLNAPVWAILNGETHHGIAWHLIEGGVDEGDLIATRGIEIAPDETAFSLNAKCYAAGIESFPEVIAAMEAGLPDRRPQDLSLRSYVARDDRPRAAARLDFAAGAPAILRLVRALDHGGYRNPLACPKIAAAGAVWRVGAAEIAEGNGASGEVLARTEDALTVACARGAVRLLALTGPDERPGVPDVAVGDILPGLDDRPAGLDSAMAAAAKADSVAMRALTGLRPAVLPLHDGDGSASLSVGLPEETNPSLARAAFCALACRLSPDDGQDIALVRPAALPGYLMDWQPLRIDTGGTAGAIGAALDAALAAEAPTWAADLPARLPGLPERPDWAVAPMGGGTGFALVLEGDTRLTLRGDPARLSEAQFDLIAGRLRHLIESLTEATPVASAELMPEAERQLVLHGWNDTATDTDTTRRLDQIIAQTLLARSDAPAILFEDQSLTGAEVEARANRLAHLLRAEGVAAGDLVGLHLSRSADLPIAALAVWKAGGAYVPMDPTYPADRIALYAEDSGARLIVSQSDLAEGLPRGAGVLHLDTDARLAQMPDTPPECEAGPTDLAYVIYTSGSTGRPKGVMLEHAQVANFFTGMDAAIPHEPGDRWMALTSLSFDISVLELFWTLSRGLTVVLSGDDSRTLVSGEGEGTGMEFSLYYWGNDDGQGRDKYRLLLEGAKFADTHGFCAVWTPERHFHAFGGPYPNPSVTGAAVAGVTERIGVRAGSCVAPLHHPARIAEEWAVIDNLTNGRAGLAIASGWQPDDFVLRPENTPPANKPAMFQTIDTLRQLWAGQAVEFPRADGTPFAVVTQPRPVSDRLPVWVTTAGNPETWREAGRIGANVLTHLLGQTAAEVGDKIALYHAALREAGHDPADHKVTLMLHTYLADSREAAREIAREPMKDYLRSAAGLIKQYAWAFPAFKKPAGVENPMQLDLGALEAEELEAILDFAFLRYFDESGLFGTVDDAMARVSELKALGVDEVACLIDYGIEVDTVLEGLRPLAQVVAESNRGLAEDDFSIAAQIRRHKVTHLQCTPSMARMLVTNDDSRAALRGLQQVLVGGEALPGALIADLAEATGAEIRNMYGPTETTIWSTTQTVAPAEGVAPIGAPIANTQVYVLDEAMTPVPVGLPGELWIGGAGVARGYWKRADLTADRFRPDPFADGKRVYRTGDLARWRADGTLDFLGRADHQVKLRGHRIELGEIETALDGVEGVAQAVVVAREDRPGHAQLVAYVTGDAVPSEMALKAHVAASLPAHMVPARVVPLDGFPLTPNRKVDRNALPAPRAVPIPVAAPAASPPPAAAPRGTVSAVAPTEPSDAGDAARVQPAIAAIWSRLLGVPAPDGRANFFELGGHSLLAVQAHREIKAELGATRLSITDIFRFPTLAALAERVATSGGAAPAPVMAPPASVARDERSAAAPPSPVGTAVAPAGRLATMAIVPVAPAPAPAPASAERTAAMTRRREMRARRLGTG